MGLKWYEEKEGSVSTMRILSMLSGVTGILISLSGTIALFLRITGSTTAMQIGLGMLGLAMGGKAVQKYAERN